MKYLILICLSVMAVSMLASCNRMTEEEREIRELVRELERELLDDIEPRSTPEVTYEHTAEVEEAEVVVFPDLNLSNVTQDVVFQSRGGRFEDGRIRISEDGVLEEHTIIGHQWQQLGHEWTVMADIENVRSVVYFPLGRGLLFVITDNNELWGMGINNNGILGDGTGVDRDDFVFILDEVANIEFYSGSVVTALRLDGTLWVWGNDVFEPVQIAEDVVRVLPGVISQRIVYQSRSGVIYGYSQDETIRFFPEPVYEILPNRSIGVDSRSLSICRDTIHNGSAFFINHEGNLIKRSNLSEGVTYEEIMPNVKNIFPATENLSINTNLFIVTNDSRLYGMGDNERGQLGDGTRVPRTDPVFIADDVVFVREYGFLKSDGTFYTWNLNDPTPVATYENVAYVFDTNVHFTDGRVLTGFHYSASRPIYEGVKLPENRVFTLD